MTNSSFFRSTPLAVFATLLLAAAAHAGPVPVANYSFESPDQTGNGLTPPPSDWTGGVYLIDKAHTNVTTDDPRDGTDQWAMLRSVSTMSQVLTTKIAPDTTYTLTIDVAQRPNKPFTAVNGVDIRLGTGSTQGANLLTVDTSATPIPTGSAWSTWSKTFTTGPSVADEFLRIEMVLADATNDAQPCFDNVRLDASTSGPDTTAPTVEFFNPSDGTTGVAVDAAISVTFTEPIAIGSGTITIRNLTDGAGGDLTISVTDATQISVVGPVLTIDPVTDFGINKDYAVQITAGAATDIAGNPYAGIPAPDTTTWNFKTETDYKVLLLGDSISGGYKAQVPTDLIGVADVYSGGSNPTSGFLNNLDSILNIGGVGPLGWDVIHFNGGLHDIAHRPDKTTNPNPAVSAAQYAANLTQIVNRLKTETNAKLIWATTTIVPPDEPIRWVGDEVTYNAIAAPIMAANGVAINDLWTLTSTFPPSYFVGPGNVHMNGSAYALISPQVTASILAALNDASPPSPDPMSFAVAPTALNATSIIMTATAATDPSGPIEYYFENTTNSDFRDWSTDTTWMNTGLSTGVSYDYQVKARDGLGFETAFSASASATPVADSTAPNPDPMSFATPPAELGESSITMTASTAIDINGVEYFFDCTTGGGHDSGWQDSASYTDTGLMASTEYTYRVQARDKSAGQISTAWSSPASATTTTPDTTPPAVSALSPENGASGVSVAASLVVTFDENVQKGAGNIVIKKLLDGAPVASIDVNSGSVTVSGAEVTITPPAILAYEAGYYVEIGNGSIEDLAGVTFPGISGSATWSFATAVNTAADIPIANQSFEAQDATTGFLTSITSWTAFKDNAGDSDPLLFDVNTHSDLNDDVDKPLPDATDNVVLLRDGADLYQVLTTKIAPNTTYTLSVDVGDHQLNPFGFGEIWLGTGSTFGLNRLIEDVESATVPVFGTGWRSWVANFTTGATVPDEFLRIEIRTLNTAESGQSDPQPFYDNVRLTATPVAGGGSPISISNSSFETDNVTGNSLGGQPPADWFQTNAGTSGSNGTAYVINKAHSNVTPPAPDDGSDKMAMLRYDVILYQVLTEKIAPNTTYTLTVDAALRNATPAEPSGATIRLGTGSSAGGNLLTADTLVTPALAESSWVEWQGTFTTGASVADEFLRVEIYYPRLDTDGDPQGLFDNVRLEAATIPPSNTFSNWIDGFGLAPADKDFADDPDGDKLVNGLEACFGTHPGEFNLGLAGLATDVTTTTFTHPQNTSPPTDVTGFYEWSPNLSDWYASGSGPGGGPTVSFVPNTVGTTTTVTATASEALDKLFLRVGVRQLP